MHEKRWMMEPQIWKGFAVGIGKTNVFLVYIPQFQNCFSLTFNKWLQFWLPIVLLIGTFKPLTHLQLVFFQLLPCLTGEFPWRIAACCG